MKHYLIAERYAKALADQIADAELQAAVCALEEAAEIYAGSDALRNVLSSPAIELEKRVEVLRQVMTAAEIVPTASRLVELLLVRGRIALLPNVNEIFGALADERLNRVRAKVTTAAKMTDDQKSRLARALGAWIGRDVHVREKLDPDILGGVVAQLAGVVIDGSVRTRVERLREELLARDIRAESA